MNEFIHKTVWRSGVVLKSGNNTALVKADMEDKKIFIWVNGAQNTRRDFLSAIRGQFDSIHKTITKLEVREKVHVPGQVDVVVDFEHLMKLERKNIDSFIPEGMDDEVSVRQLLNGVARESDRQQDYITVNIHGNVQDSTIAVGDGNQLNSNRRLNMDIPTIALSVSSALAPYFPYLIKGVKLAGQKWFEALGEKAGEETVKQATKTWESIKSKAPENKTIEGAALMLSDDPANESVRKMFSDALAEVLKKHPELLQELTEFQRNAPSITLDQRSGGVYFEGSGNVNIKGDVVGRDQTKGK
jgi:internalin A